MTFRYVPLDTGYGIYYMPLLFAEICHPEDRTKKKGKRSGGYAAVLRFTECEDSATGSREGGDWL
jgi:hypothetical protein